MTERRNLTPELIEQVEAMDKDLLVCLGDIQLAMNKLNTTRAKFARSVEGEDVCNIMEPSLELLKASKDLKACANKYWEVFDLDTVDGWDY